MSRDLTIDELDELMAAQGVTAGPPVTSPKFLVGGDQTAAPPKRVPAPEFFDPAEWDLPIERPLPDVFDVEGGEALGYSGASHVFFGHGGDGKSYLAAWLMAQLLKAGKVCLWIDYESDKETLRLRLRGFGVTAEHASTCAYWRVGGAIGGAVTTEWDVRLSEFLEEFRPELTVLDSLSRAMSLANLNESDNSDAGFWWMRTVRAQFELRELTALVIAHLGHANENGKDRLTPRGASSYLQMMTGAAYRVDVVKAFSQHSDGQLRLLCAKDRGGGRAKGDVAADVFVTVGDDGDGASSVRSFRLAAPDPDAQVSPAQFRFTGVMEKLSRHLEGRESPATKRDLRSLGKAEHVDAAVSALVDEGFVGWDEAKRSNFRSVRPYRQKDDPLSDKFTGSSADDRPGDAEPF